MNNENLHKEIGLIQSIITRMGNYSFLLKFWMITLVVLVLALTKDTIATNDASYLSIILFLPLFTFWYLDAFFLHKERCYGKLYAWVIYNRKITDDFLYSLNYTRFEDQVDGIGKIMLSKTLLPFYGLTGVILIAISILALINNTNPNQLVKDNQSSQSVSINSSQLELKLKNKILTKANSNELLLDYQASKSLDSLISVSVLQLQKEKINLQSTQISIEQGYDKLTDKMIECANKYEKSKIDKECFDFSVNFLCPGLHPICLINPSLVNEAKSYG